MVEPVWDGLITDPLPNLELIKQYRAVFELLKSRPKPAVPLQSLAGDPTVGKAGRHSPSISDVSFVFQRVTDPPGETRVEPQAQYTVPS